MYNLSFWYHTTKYINVLRSGICSNLYNRPGICSDLYKPLKIANHSKFDLENSVNFQKILGVAPGIPLPEVGGAMRFHLSA